MKATRCTVPGCDRYERCKQMCSIHYDRMRKRGTTDLPPPHVDPGCAVEGCDRPHNCRGYCRLHYKRMLEYGDVLADKPIAYKPKKAERNDVVSRIMARTEPDGDCIVWTGFKLHSGYGTIGWQGRDWVVHRAIWTVAHGPIPEDGDWTVDHLCFNRACVNIDHLDLVTRGENTRRSLLRRYPDGPAARARLCEAKHLAE